MDFSLTTEEEAVRDAARQFARRELAPGAAERDATETVPRELITALAEVGFLGGVVPEEYGGAGLNHVAFVAMLEELSRVDHIVASIASFPSSLCGSGILRYGSEELKRRYLPAFCDGTRLGAAAVTEPGSGTDVAGMRTTAELCADGYVLRGSKMWISNLDHAHWFLTFARLRGGSGHEGICAFVVERDSPGLRTNPVNDKLGFRPLKTGEVSFDDVVVPPENLVGEEGQGFAVAMTSVESGRLGVAARACGVLAACVDAATEYAKSRTTFGNPIASYQLVQAKISDMVVGLETARLLTYRLSWLKDRGDDGAGRRASSMAKMHASDMLMRAAVDAAQIFGAYTASPEYPVGRYLRDAKIFQIVEGSNDLHRLLIAESQTGIPSAERQRGRRKAASAA